MKLALLLSLALALGVLLRLAIPHIGKSAAGGVLQTNGRHQLADCPDTPNCQCSMASNASQHTDSIVVTGDPETVVARMAAIIEQLPGTKVLEQDDRYLHATFSSPIMGYIDDLELLLDDDNQTLQIRSASRLGKSDLGANAKRIEQLRQLAASSL